MTDVRDIYQTKMDDDITAMHAAGVSNVLGVLPTGGGKSKIMSRRIRRFALDGAYQAVIAHRQELVSQMSIHVASVGVPHRIIGPPKVIAGIVAAHRKEFGQSFVNPSARTAVAGVDTLIRRHQELEQWRMQVDNWMIDEAHHVLRTNKWGTAVEMFPNAFGDGFTASPERADGAGLGEHHDGVFGGMVLGPYMRQLIDMDALCEYEFVVPESDFDIESLKITDSGDFSPTQLKQAADKSHIVGDVVDQYILHAYGKRGITFATDVDTAQKIARRFNEYGIPAAAVSANTPDDVRREYIQQFKDGKLLQLVNVDLFGEGFDVPAVEVVSMARPTASLAVYLQQCGRALRVLFGKIRGLIIDHVSNFKRHGPPDKPRFWTLDRRDKRAKRPSDPEEIELKGCTNCSRPYSPTLRKCPYCKHTPVPLAGGRSVEEVDGDLMLLTVEILAKMRAATALESPISVGERVGAVAGGIAAKSAINDQIERIGEQTALKDAIAWYAGHERAKGRDDSEIMRRFYLTLGIDVATSLTLKRAEMEKIRVKVESWYK